MQNNVLNYMLFMNVYLSLLVLRPDNKRFDIRFGALSRHEHRFQLNNVNWKLRNQQGHITNPHTQNRASLSSVPTFVDNLINFEA